MQDSEIENYTYYYVPNYNLPQSNSYYIMNQNVEGIQQEEIQNIEITLPDPKRECFCNII